MNGIEHIQSAFAAARSPEAAPRSCPICTLGYPSRAVTLDVLEAVARAGADLIELGVPFSDPLADGPTIQHSTQVALEQGMTVAGCLEMRRATARRGRDAAAAADGLHQPDPGLRRGALLPRMPRLPGPMG